MDNFSQQYDQSNQYFASCKFNSSRDLMIKMLTWEAKQTKRILGLLFAVWVLATVLILAFDLVSALGFGICLFVTMFFGMRFFMYNKVIEKSADKLIATKGYSCTTILFYDSYMIINSERERENNSMLVGYDKLKESIIQDDHIYFTFYRNGEKRRWVSCVDLCALQGDKQRVFEVFKNIENFKQKRTAQNQMVKQSNKTKIFLLVLFVVTILSLWIAPMIANMLVQSSPLPEFSGTFPEKMWVCWALLPIPALSICLGVYFGKKGYKAKKNVVAGFIIAVLLGLFGCFSVFIQVEHDMAFLNEIEAVTSITLPDDGYISVIVANESNPKTEALARFYDEQKNQFANMVETDDRWQSNLNGFYAGVDLYYQVVTSDYDRFCFYDVSKNTYNSCNAPTSNFVYMAYKIDEGLLYIIYV